ncbi:MAG: MAPEG family protein [Pseudomonadota bacterium]
MDLPISALYTGILGLWVLLLGLRVSMRRHAAGVSLGDGGDAALHAAIRAHGNAVETIPLALLMLGLAESIGTPAWLLHLFGLCLVAGRLAHGLHFVLGRKDVTLRAVGMSLTILVTGIMGIGLVGHGLIGSF